MKTYPLYLQHEESSRVIKVSAPCDLYLVQVIGFKNGSFRHRRERLVFQDLAKFEEYLKPFMPAFENDYVNMLKNYFEIDKTIRDMFIRQYDLTLENQNNQSF